MGPKRTVEVGPGLRYVVVAESNHIIIVDDIVMNQKKMRFADIFWHSYIFWALFSLINFSFFAYLAFPLLLPIAWPKLSRFFPFLIIPALFALLLCVILFHVVKRYSAGLLRSHPHLSVYLFNSFFLLAFLLIAEHQKNVMIATYLVNRNPECIRVNSFLKSLNNAGSDFQFVEHAMFREHGRNYYWSYSAMDFYEGNEGLDNNFSCRN
jgi:hypothetical protein